MVGEATKKKPMDVEYWLKYFSFAHRLELPVQTVKVFCKKPFLLHLWPKRKQEKAEIILFRGDPKDHFPNNLKK